MKTLLTLGSDREDQFFIKGDPLGLVGGYHMVQGRHAKTLVIFTLQSSGTPQSDGWGGGETEQNDELGLEAVTGSCQEQYLEWRQISRLAFS